MVAIRIRSEQLHALETCLNDRLRERIAAHLVEHHEPVVRHLSPSRLLDEVAGAIERAAVYGFEWQTSILAYVLLTFHVGPYFDCHPRISRILSDHDMPPDSRIEYLSSAITADEWQEARQTPVPHALRARGQSA
jgi:hypothetical protein